LRESSAGVKVANGSDNILTRWLNDLGSAINKNVCTVLGVGAKFQMRWAYTINTRTIWASVTDDKFLRYWLSV